MALLVQKFGGTSLGSFERIKIVAQTIKASRDAGNNIVVVVSAMSGQTNKLHSLAHGLSATPDKSELDAILATGEQVSAALLAIALCDIDCPAQSFGAAQLNIRGDDCSNYARLISLSTKKLSESLASGSIPIVTGFQAVGSKMQWVTMGRGGSDTTAVAIAAKLSADECQIYTDVRGVYTADPRIVQSAKLLSRVNSQALSFLASAGAKVMQRRAIECACRHKVPLRILSSFEPGEGTLITDEEHMEDYAITGLAFERDQIYVKVSLTGAEFKSELNRLMRFFAQRGAHIDYLRQDYTGKSVMCSFVLPESMLNDLDHAISCCQSASIDVESSVQSGLARLSVVGIGIGSRPQVAARILAILAENRIAIEHMLTEEHRCSLLMANDAVEKAAKCLHEEFVNKQDITVNERC